MQHQQGKFQGLRGDGEKGLEKEVILELKLLADVGLIGFPNVGKSTILSIVTQATPKIADYHFTTIDPNLGVAKTKRGDSFVIADIPGIIEGASQGVGLGLQFLRHIERTRLLLHVIDVSGSEGRDPIQDFNLVQEELKNYSEKLSTRKQIIVANKQDIAPNEENYQKLEALAKSKGIPIFKISAATKQGIDLLLDNVAEILKSLPKEELIDIDETITYTQNQNKNEFTIKKENGKFIVQGTAANYIMSRINPDDNESLYYFQKKLQETGIEQALKDAGVMPGDTVCIEQMEFEWY